MKQPDSLSRLINKFTFLPGVGTKTAQRYAYAVMDMSADEVREFADALLDVKNKIRLCGVCGGLSEEEVCPICRTRDSRVICVVAYPKDILAMEKAGFNGVYHVLHGTISPMDGRGPDDIRVKELLPRLATAEEVIMATNPDVEGEATALYIAKLIKPLGVKVTRLAQGISLGSDIEYADEITLSRAIDSRTEL